MLADSSVLNRVISPDSLLDAVYVQKVVERPSIIPMVSMCCPKAGSFKKRILYLMAKNKTAS